jgi:hypothetical protein
LQAAKMDYRQKKKPISQRSKPKAKVTNMTDVQTELLQAILAELEAIRKENLENTKEICDAVKYYSGI